MDGAAKQLPMGLAVSIVVALVVFLLTYDYDTFLILNDASGVKGAGGAHPSTQTLEDFIQSCV